MTSPAPYREERSNLWGATTQKRSKKELVGVCQNGKGMILYATKDVS